VVADKLNCSVRLDKSSILGSQGQVKQELTSKLFGKQSKCTRKKFRSG